jgi:hypothetical protein
MSCGSLPDHDRVDVIAEQGHGLRTLRDDDDVTVGITDIHPAIHHDIPTPTPRTTACQEYDPHRAERPENTQLKVKRSPSLSPHKRCGTRFTDLFLLQIVQKSLLSTAPDLMSIAVIQEKQSNISYYVYILYIDMDIYICCTRVYVVWSGRMAFHPSLALAVHGHAALGRSAYWLSSSSARILGPGSKPS